MALQKLAIAIFAYYAAITIQGCGGEEEPTKTAEAMVTNAPTAAAWVQNKKYKYTC